MLCYVMLLFAPWLTQPSIIKWSVNEYRLRLERFKEGVCATLLGARHVPERLSAVALST